MTAIPALLPLRRATCALSAGPFRATGWLVSAKGLFVSSHSALGYHVEIEIENEAGDRKPGRVVAVDVARDLTFVLATDGLPRQGDTMTPLLLREMPAVKLGERALAAAALPNRGIRLWPATICALPRSIGPSERFDTDATAVGPAGGPLVDGDGRAIGILVRDTSPGTVRDGASGPRSSLRRATALPAAEVRAALRPVESASELSRRSPIYRCPTCTSPFVPDLDACLGCGFPIPHPHASMDALASRTASERALRDAFAAIGLVANRVRTGARTWHLPPRSAPSGDAAPIGVELDEDGGGAVFRAPVARLPKAAREPFYRLLLTLNDQSTGPFRLALDGERVALLFATHPSALRDQDLAQSLASLVEMAEHYRKILHEGFDAAPLLGLEEPAEW